MSLRVWLPLINDTHNQGSLYLPTPWDARSRDTGGKLGQYCYSDNAIYHIENEWLGNIWSLACWVKSSGWSRYNDIILCKNTSSIDSAQFYLSIIGGTQLNIGCNAGSQTLTIGNTFATNTWYHIASTYDGSTLKLYLNGNEVGTKAYVSTQKTGMNNLGIGCRSTNAAGTSATGGANKRTNDIRIYDHCLSPLEVKEISQGLVLHYPLNSTLIESSTNLVTTEDCFSGATCYNGATNKYNYGTNTDMYKTVGVFQGRQSTKVYMGTNGLDAYPYVYFNAFSAAGTVIQSLSFDYFPTSQSTLIPYSYNGTYNWKYKVNGVSGVANNTSTCPTLNVKLNQWNHVEITAVKYDTTNTSRGIGYVRIGSAKHVSTTTDYWLFANVQIENKDHSTLYMGVGGSRIGYVTDNSGFGYGGTITGNLACVSDSPRYDVSTKIAPASSGIKIPNFSIDNIWSLSLWFKYPSQDSSGWKALVILNNNGGDADLQLGNYINCSGNQIQYSANGKYTTGVTFTYGDWHHIVNTYDGTTLRCYLDGVYKTSVTPGQTLLRTNLGIGCRATAIDFSSISNSATNAQISDVRIYATALSEADIKALYNTSANIDNLGNFHSFEFVEGDRKSIDKNGVAHTSELYEYSGINASIKDSGVYNANEFIEK